MESARKAIEDIYRAAIKAVDPRSTVASWADYIRRKCAREGIKFVVPIAFGKAACPMTEGLHTALDNLMSPGIVVTKYGHCRPTQMPSGFKLMEAGHPVPDGNSLTAARTLIECAKQPRQSSLIVCLISGGGSSLLAMPQKGIELEEKQRLVELLLKAGADIQELNCVRKHVSAIKGGRLATTFFPSPVVSLIISDVIGDRVDVIASGPTAPDMTTYREAYGVLEKYGLINSVPQSVVKLLLEGVQGTAPETPKSGDPVFDTVENIIIAGNAAALKTAAEKARSMGFQTLILKPDLQGEAREAGKELARMISRQEFTPPFCFLSGGETTVTVRGRGTGGRNLELALGFALEIHNLQRVYLLSAATDGDDNSTGSAGAFVDDSTLSRAQAMGLDPVLSLQKNDSYTFFRNLGDLFQTGLTGTNVMDIQIVLCYWG